MIVTHEVNLEICASGVRHFDNDGYQQKAGIKWVLLSPTEITRHDDELLHVLDMERYCNGPGRPFGMQADIRRSKSRVLVTQRFGLDI